MPVRDADQRVILRTDWAGYAQLLEVQGERSVPRIAYDNGMAELISPSARHERIKTTIAPRRSQGIHARRSVSASSTVRTSSRSASPGLEARPTSTAASASATVGPRSASASA